MVTVVRRFLATHELIKEVLVENSLFPSGGQVDEEIFLVVPEIEIVESEVKSHDFGRLYGRVAGLELVKLGS